MIRQLIRNYLVTCLAICSVFSLIASAQKVVTSTNSIFPPPEAKNFTAAKPTVEEVDAFLKASWGYDPNRVWQVQAIMKTPVEGVSKVIVAMGDKTGRQKSTAPAFFVFADGKHLMAGDQILPFGDKPFAEYRALLQKNADGPYRGVASKELEIVEFADLECPHCKEAQADMDKLVADFPKAHIVFQNYPLERIHPAAKKAAEYGVCVARQGSNDAFFQYAAAVYENQDGLSTKDGAELTLNSAVAKAGLDPEKIAACAQTPEVDAAVEASVNLAEGMNVNQTPELVVNGRAIPMTGNSYPVIKEIIEYQEKLDGIAP